MALEHTFYGTWEIIGCTFEGKQEISGLEGIKFRLDETGDITWYNDLINPLPSSSFTGTSASGTSSSSSSSSATSKNLCDPTTCLDSVNMLFNCETYDVNELNPRLVFGAFAGYSIEFNTHTLMPSETLVLTCENWYSLLCKRLKEDQAVCQEKQFSFIDALNEGYFSDVIIKSSDNLDYHVHSAILRLNGFDCSMYSQSSGSGVGGNTTTTEINSFINIDKMIKNSTTNQQVVYPNQVKISITIPHHIVENPNTTNLPTDRHQVHHRNLSPIYLLPLPPININDGLTMCKEKHLSTSFNCLNKSPKDRVNDNDNDTSRSSNKKLIKKCPTSSSDSNLKENANQNIFNFSNDLFLQPIENLCGGGGGGGGVSGGSRNRKPPLSPYRARSPLPFTPNTLDTPPSSPLTPIGVLYNLPSFMLSPILHWLYTESLMDNLDEDICEKLINFAETQPPLIKLVEPYRKYLKLIRLKKFVIDLIMDMHNVLNKIIQSINPHTIYHQPSVLFNTFIESLKEGAVGCAKILQFCNIFIEDAADISRAQKHEIIKYVRTRLPIFMSQIHQLLKNILSIFVSLNDDEKIELSCYLVPEIESSLKILTSVVEEIKNSLEKMCKDLRCSHLDLSKINKDESEDNTGKNRGSGADGDSVFDDSGGCGGGGFGDGVNIKLNEKQQQQLDINFQENFNNIFPLKRPSIYDDIPKEKRFVTVENDLKFVLYMYEVRKMRDIYGRITAALDIIREKKTAFCEMNLADKRSTIQQNLEQLILDIPNYIFIIENISDRLDDKMGWKEFKFCFKLATNQINGVIIKLLDHKPALRDPINHICKLVQKDEFTKSLIDLGLLQNYNNVLTNELQQSNLTINNDNKKITNYDYKNVKLNLIRSLCESPIVINSCLSKNALRLLHSGQLADMEFEVYVQHHHNHHQQYQHQYESSSPVPLNENSIRMKGELENECRPSQVHTFRAHRVIVSARCEWFKKALLSGMQESINRKIIISDTSPVIFRRLLLYLYGAPIDKTVGAEQICELMLLADRYSIDDLKELCENTLNALIDEDSVLCLLGIADRYRATGLKSSCLSFLSQHSNLTKLDMFKELPKSIQLEVHDLIHWYGRVSEPWNDGGLKTPRSTSRHSLKSPSKPKSRSRKSSPSFM